MSTIDIRGESVSVETIVFADPNSFDYTAFKLHRTKDMEVFKIVSEDDASVGVYYKDVENLIKALQKAVELGWTK